MDPDPSSYLYLLNILQPFELSYLILIFILMILLLGSALISGSEVAFFSLKGQDLEALRNDKKDVHEKLSELLNHPKSLLATILIGNNFINVGIVILSSYLSNQLFDFSGHPAWWGFLFQVVVITFLILLFGEVLPKVYATRNPIYFSAFMSRPMLRLRWLFRPVSVVLVRSTNLVEKGLRGSQENLSVDDLSQALELTTHDATTHGEQRILEGIVKFGSTNVRQIMKPRMDVVSVDVSWDYEKIMSVILDSGYSRIPVFEENFDQIKGDALHQRPLATYSGR
ncbi:MAG: CNNM domain-containing protein [Owenweeksia sp.]|nr:CNNM domain-containing protein [Owenweeksia sp.]